MLRRSIKISRSWISICGNRECEHTHWQKRQQRQAETEGVGTTKMILFSTRKQQQWRVWAEGLAAWLKYQGLNSFGCKRQHTETFHFQAKQITSKSLWHLSVDFYLHRLGIAFQIFQAILSIFFLKGRSHCSEGFGAPFLFFLIYQALNQLQEK